MKNNLLILFIMLVNLFAGPAIAQTQGLSSNAQRFKTNLLSFLREEGYTPTVDNDGKTINLKRQGENYWINLSGSLPVQVTVNIGGFGNKDANALAILLACNEVNKALYYVKAYVDDFGDNGNTCISIEMPCHTAEEFRYVFNDCVNSLATAKTKIQESYDENRKGLDESNKPFNVTACSVGNQDTNRNTITAFGNNIYSYQTKYLVPQLTIQSENSGNYTIYYKLYTPNGTLSTGTSSPSGYSSSTSLYIYSGTRTYTLKGWGSNTSGHWGKGKYKYEFYCNGSSLGYYEFTIY